MRVYKGVVCIKILRKVKTEREVLNGCKALGRQFL